MSKTEYNENYTHSCEKDKVQLVIYRKNFSDEQSDICSSEDFRRVIDFYVSKAPILKNGEKSGADFGLRCLSDIGWKGSALGKLEKELKAVAGLTLYFIRSDSIKNIIEAMNLDKEICYEHPRGVLKHNFKLKAKENGEIEVTNSETRMECLFRHIRNSLAHGRTYVFNKGFILLEDCDENGIISARLLLKFQSLLDWIDIINNPRNYLNSRANQK